jgi:hypothetical protein
LWLGAFRKAHPSLGASLTFSEHSGVSPPYDEALLFRQKAPKPHWPLHGPSGALRSSPTPAAFKLAPLKHCPPFLRCRLHCSAMPQGQGILWKEKEDGSPITTVGDDGGEWQTNSPGSDKVHLFLGAPARLADLQVVVGGKRRV